jgi:inorganic phosphate transporter, PiT family
MDISTLFVIITLIFGFYMSFNIGANDVANAMGTSVGSKALTLKKAVFLAAILEFCGAFFIGAPVSQTIQHGIIHVDLFSFEPMLFVIGMLSALITTGLWLQIASHLGIPVSTTHAIVGAVIGFGAALGGFSSIQWSEITQIFAGWIFSPLISGALSYFLFTVIQRSIFFSKNPLHEAIRLFPTFMGLSLFVFFFSLFFEGSVVSFSFPFALFLSLCLASLTSFISKMYVKRKYAPATPTYGLVTSAHTMKIEKALKQVHQVQKSLDSSWEDEITPVKSQIAALKEKMHSFSEKTVSDSPFFKVEKLFVILQVFSACLVAFAHGGNDVANAVGPVSAILRVLSGEALQSSFPISPWLLAFGGMGIVLGLVFLGWKVIETVGTKITELTPTRGFCAEFGAAITILFASKLGLPISTTHALVGAVLGVGLARGISALNLSTLKEIALSWIVTIPACAIFSSVVFIALKALFATI